MNNFLDDESIAIINKLTNTPFYDGENLHLYWLFKLELLPGAWRASFYLDDIKPNNVYRGYGSPSKAVLDAYNEINQKWLSTGFEKGKKYYVEMGFNN